MENATMTNDPKPDARFKLLADMSTHVWQQPGLENFDVVTLHRILKTLIDAGYGGVAFSMPRVHAAPQSVDEMIASVQRGLDCILDYLGRLNPMQMASDDEQQYFSAYDKASRLIPDALTHYRSSLDPFASIARETFQARVGTWLLTCFGQEIARDKFERNHRFIEEALELVQASGCTRSEAHQIVDYVFDRPVGELAQEVGGVEVTLAALCLANDIDMHEAAEAELAQVWTKVDQIRAKHAAKPKHSPLPQAHESASAARQASANMREAAARVADDIANKQGILAINIKDKHAIISFSHGRNLAYIIAAAIRGLRLPNDGSEVRG